MVGQACPKYLGKFAISLWHLKKSLEWIRNLTSLAGLNPTLTVCYSFHIVLLPSQYGIWLLCLCNLTLPVPCISQSYTEIKIKLNFYFHTSLWCPKTFVWKRFLILIWTWPTVPVYGEQSWPLWSLRDHSFSAYAKFSEKLIFLTPWYSHVVCVSGGKKFLFFGKFCARTKWMIPDRDDNLCDFDFALLFHLCFHWKRQKMSGVWPFQRVQKWNIDSEVI